MFLLYSGHATGLLKLLIEESRQNLRREFPSEGVEKALDFDLKSDSSISLLRVVFFLFLSKDGVMRKKICEAQIAWFLPTLCPHKACVFYEALDVQVIPQWIKNESIELLDFEELIRDSYLNA